MQLKFREVPLLILFLMFQTLLGAGEIHSFAETWNLKRCFGLALKNSENIAFSGEAIKKAEAQYHQALGKSLPEFSFHYSSLWQDQKGSEQRAPMATVIIWGTAVSMFLTLYVVPCAYSLFSRLESKKHAKEHAEALQALSGA